MSSSDLGCHRFRILQRILRRRLSLIMFVGTSVLLSSVHAQSSSSPPASVATPAAMSSSSSTAAADAQNPIAHVISVPLQANIYTRAGPAGKTASTWLLEPVVPFKLNAEWSVVTRTIIPLIHEPRSSPEQGGVTSLGNIEPQFYVTPAHPGKFIWGAGAQVWLPTATNSQLGYNRWGGGPSFVGLIIEGPWVAGALLNNVWAGSGPQRVNELTFNPFVNFNLHAGWYLTSTPIITANWVKSGSDRWTVPVGGGAGRVFTLDGTHFNARLEFFVNAGRPENAPRSQVQFQLQILFPEHG